MTSKVKLRVTVQVSLKLVQILRLVAQHLPSYMNIK